MPKASPFAIPVLDKSSGIPWDHEVLGQCGSNYWTNLDHGPADISFRLMKHVSFGFLYDLHMIFQCFNLSHGLKPFLVSQVGHTETESK